MGLLLTQKDYLSIYINILVKMETKVFVVNWLKLVILVILVGLVQCVTQGHFFWIFSLSLNVWFKVYLLKHQGLFVH